MWMLWKFPAFFCLSWILTIAWTNELAHTIEKCCLSLQERCQPLVGLEVKICFNKSKWSLLTSQNITLPSKFLDFRNARYLPLFSNVPHCIVVSIYRSAYFWHKCPASLGNLSVVLLFLSKCSHHIQVWSKYLCCLTLMVNRFETWLLPYHNYNVIL